MVRSRRIRALPPGVPEPAEPGRIDVAGAVDALRYKIARAEAFAATAHGQFDDARDDPRGRERLSYLVEEAAKAITEALEDCEELQDGLARAKAKARTSP